MNAVDVRREGMQLSGTPLWLDATRKRPLGFVSHAHADHIAKHEAVIATRATLRFLSHRLGVPESAQHHEYRQPFALGAHTLELFPAGHILGSAQLRVTRPDGKRVTFTGDLNTVDSLTAEALEVADCDTLVLESTFGHPRFSFPPRDATFDAIAHWARDCFARETVPVLWGYALGKSQEAMAVLARMGFRLCAHPKVHAVAALYTELGRPVTPRLYDGTLQAEEIAVFPPRHRPEYDGRRIETAMLSGWAMDAMAISRYRADRAFAVSDHADCASLVEYARRTGARTVLTHHGFAKELAQTLRDAGLDAYPAGQKHQLAFDF